MAQEETPCNAAQGGSESQTGRAGSRSRGAEGILQEGEVYIIVFIIFIQTPRRPLPKLVRYPFSPALLPLAGSLWLLTACSWTPPAQTSTSTAASLSGTPSAAGLPLQSGGPFPYGPPRSAVPLERNQRSFFVHAIFNGRLPARLLLDTGAAYVTIHEDMARSLGLDLLHAEPVNCVLADGSQAQAHRAYLHQVRLAGTVLHRVPVLVMPTPPTPTHDGLLGMSFLENFLVELDTAQPVLWLTPRVSGPGR